MSKKKYTKCQCCPYYALDFTDNKWKCVRNDKNKDIYNSTLNSHCIFKFDNDESKKQKVEIIERWINANKGE